jgi:hypothetical protein
MKFGVGVILVKLSSKAQCRENWRSGSHASLKGVSEFMPYFTHFLTDFCERQCRISLLNVVQRL